MVYIIYTQQLKKEYQTMQKGIGLFNRKLQFCLSFFNFSNWLRFIFLLGQSSHFCLELITFGHLWFWWISILSVAILMSSNLIRVIVFIGIHFFITTIIVFESIFIFVTWKVAIIIIVIIIWAWISFAVIFIKKLSLLVIRLVFIRVTVLYIVNVISICLLTNSSKIWVQSCLLMVLLSNLEENFLLFSWQTCKLRWYNSAVHALD